MTPRLHEHVDRFLERNTFAHAALGLLSYGGRFEAFWDSVLAGVRPERTPAAEAAREVYVVLGALHVTRRVRGILTAFAREPPAHEPPRARPAGPRARVPRRVLR